ncbi:MAG TPA: type II secretion system protein [Candidatus Saccharimonadales bacterium]
MNGQNYPRHFSHGFTIIEVIVAVAIILILTTIAVVNVMSSQVVARDAEREEDIRSIAIHFENYYNDLQFNRPFDPAPTYPHTVPTSDVLAGLDPEAYRAPGTPSGTNSIVAATNTVTTTAGVLPQPTINQYVYQPFNISDQLCTDLNGPCVKYNLYWRSEGDNTIKKIVSRHQ